MLLYYHEHYHRSVNWSIFSMLVVDYVEIISVLGFILPGNDRSKYREIQCWD